MMRNSLILLLALVFVNPLWAEPRKGESAFLDRAVTGKVGYLEAGDKILEVIEGWSSAKKEPKVRIRGAGAGRPSGKLEVWTDKANIEIEGGDASWAGNISFTLEVPIEFRYTVDLERVRQSARYDRVRNTVTLRVGVVQLEKPVADRDSMTETNVVKPYFRRHSTLSKLKENALITNLDPLARSKAEEKRKEAEEAAVQVLQEHFEGILRVIDPKVKVVVE
jgi:hypothetical protein